MTTSCKTWTSTDRTRSTISKDLVVTRATTAGTLEQLGLEVDTLKALERQAFGVLHSGRDAKWTQLNRILDDPLMVDTDGNRRKLIVFTEPKDTLHYLRDKIQARLGNPDAVAVIHGGVTREERRKVIERFMQDRDLLVLVANDAAGEGVNLQRGHLMVNYDLPWNPNKPEPASRNFIRWLHAEFYRDVPQAMLSIRSDHAEFRMTPGEWRSAPEHDVAVGRHIPPSSRSVEPFMAHFERRYRFEGTGPAARILAMAAAHHRLNYIHPFPDGNGRVSRLMSHAMALKAGIGAHGLWSVSRGLARGLDSRREYRTWMDRADTPRQGDLDGRGNLSRSALVDFTLWFLEVCLDQVTFMGALFDLDNLDARLARHVERSDTLKPEAARLLREALVRGRIDRGEASRITGLPERTARRVLGDIVDAGLLASATPKGPVSLRFPVDTLEGLFPRLYPET